MYEIWHICCIFKTEFMKVIHEYYQFNIMISYFNIQDLPKLVKLSGNVLSIWQTKGVKRTWNNYYVES